MSLETRSTLLTLYVRARLKKDQRSFTAGLLEYRKPGRTEEFCRGQCVCYVCETYPHRL